MAELLTELDERSALATTGPGQRWAGPAVVLLLAGARRLRQVPGLSRVLDEGPAAGIYAICLDDHRTRLPVECGAVLQLPGREARPGTGPVVFGVQLGIGELRLDGVSGAWAERLGRALAPLREATPDPGRAGVPEVARLVDLLDVDPAEPAALAAHWRRGAGSTVAVIGATADGPYAVDLRSDGPHVLIGGTTGAGKSELLQTLITSLAANNSPQQLGFVLVDYKGGAAFQQCAELPHTLGLVTDLDPQLTERALSSLRAELRRREELLRTAGAKDVEEYARCRPGASFPRLVLVVDEFRMLAQEQPAFLDGVLRIAALGRSLGVHLVLATQRPAGVVSADIAANVNLRIALRVRDRADSEDVIDAPDAAEIGTASPGRAYARSGAQPLVLFQTARVAGPRTPGGSDATVRTVTVADLGELGELDRGAAPVDTEDTDLRAIVAAAREASRRLGLPPVPSPWLPPLPEIVTLAELASGRSGWRVPYAVVDRPEQQAQETLAWDLEHDGHLLVVGGLRSGRSSCLRTLAGSAACRFTAAEVHVHGIDGGTGALLPLSRLPHAGVLAGADDVARGVRLVDRLLEEVAARQAAMSAAGLAAVAEQYARLDDGCRQPYLVLLLDGWESISAAWEQVEHGRPIDALLQLMRDGASVGLRVVVSGDRGLLLSRMASLARDRLVLRLADPGDLLLAGVAPGAVPVHQPPGRGLRLPGQTEVQVALLASDPSPAAQVAALAEIAGRAAVVTAGAGHQSGPLHIEPLPPLVTATELTDTAGQARRGWALVGAGGDTAQAVGLDVAGTSVTVAGPRRSGRTTALGTMARWLAEHGTDVVLLTGGPSPLEELGRLECVRGVVPATEPGSVQALLERHPACCVLVDDVERIADSAAEDLVVQWFREAERAGGGLVVAGSSPDLAAMFRGLTVVSRRSAQGVLLCPGSPTDGDLLGVRVSPTPGVPRPGRGLLVRRGAAVPVQVAV